MEEIRPIPGYNGYFATSSGRILSNKCPYPGKTAELHDISHRIRDGYVYVAMYVEPNKSVGRYVHKLVLLAFKGEAPQGCEASHIDGNSLNNRPDNLVWEPHRMNVLRKREHGTLQVGSKNGNSSLTESEVLTIKKRLQIGDRQRTIASDFSVSEQCISDIKHRRRWSHV